MQLADNPLTPDLRILAENVKKQSLSSMIFTQNREKDFCRTLGDLEVDITRQRITPEILNALYRLARHGDVKGQIDAMLAGEAINYSEKRPIGHMAMRHPDRQKTAEWKKITLFTEEIRREKKYTDIVNIGIGGSELGPAMVSTALHPFSNSMRVHYVSNLDPAHMHDVLQFCKPESCLFIVTSKTFTTAETLQNAKLATKWLKKAGIDKSALIAVTVASQKAADWGAGRVFEFPEGVGGRYSLWSAVSLPVILSIGIEHFTDFLSGAYAIDAHIISAPDTENIPLLLALLRVWNRNFLHYPSHGIIPYNQRLMRLPAWAQQLEMESNGKGVDRFGKKLKIPASPLIWGETGTNAQHSFFQYLHQGLDIVPLDILLPRQPIGCDALEGSKESHYSLAINAIAQAEALACGSENIAEPHRHFSGNRPSSVISWGKTTPYAVGRLLALYEYITIFSGFLWGINSFDQWGVELGKQRANELQSGGLKDFSPVARRFITRLNQSS